MQTLKFPSTKTAWLFTEEAQAQGYHARIPATVQILPRVTVWAVVIGGLAGGALLGAGWRFAKDMGGEAKPPAGPDEEKEVR